MIKIYYLKAKDTKKNSRKYLKSIISEDLHINESILNIEYDESSKPYIKNINKVKFNCSHTKDIFVCALANNNVGIDIEKIGNLNLRIVDYFFTLDEKEYILSAKENKNYRFTEIWTKKESYLKWLGTGIEIPIKKFSIFEIQKINNIKIETINVEKYIISICFLGKQKIKLIKKSK